MPRYIADRGDYLKIAVARAIPQVVDPVFPRLHVVQSQQVGGGKICDVDVVAHTGPVTRGVILTKQRELLTLTGNYVQCEGNDVRLGIVPLTDHRTVWQSECASDIEVAQADRAQRTIGNTGGGGDGPI